MATLQEKSNPSSTAEARPTREQCIQEAGAVLAFWLRKGASTIHEEAA